VDALGVRANPRRIADDVKAAALEFVKKPAVAASLAGLGAVVLVVFVKRVRNR